MSIKIPLTMTDIGVLDSMSNPVQQNGRGCRLLQDMADLYADGSLKTQPGVTKVLGAPLLADYTAGTVTVSNGSKTITGGSTSWLANAFPGDIIVLPDGVYYTIASVETDTSATLRTKYQGTSASGGTYTIKHRVWMMAPFYGSVGTAKKTVEQSYKSTTLGTGSNIESTPWGLALAPSFECTNTASVRTDDNSRLFNSTTARTKVGTQFTVASNVTVAGVWFDLGGGASADAAFTITLQTETVNAYGGSPSGTLVHANATTGSVTSTTQYAASRGKSGLWYDFGGNVSLVAGTKYWFVLTADNSSWVDFVSKDAQTTTGITTTKTLWYKASGTPQAWFDQYTYGPISFSFTKYPTSGTNTYVTPVFDIGYTPTAAGTLTINRASYQSNRFSVLSSAFLNAQPSFPDTLTWELNTSASSDMSSPTQVATGQTAMTYTITGAANLKRYYQLTLTMTSAAGWSSPLVSGADIYFQATADEAKEENLWRVVGCGPNIYSDIKSGAATISTTAVPMGREVRPVQYQRNLIWSGVGQAPRYWNGVSAADAAVSAMTKSDGTAGTDPPVRGWHIVQHNDKLFILGDVEIQYFTGASTGQTDTVTTDSGATFTTSGTGMIGWRLYPDATNYPRLFWPITTNNGTSATSAGAKMNSLLGTNLPAVTGDTYLVTRRYGKAAWYTTETEAADWPTTNFLKFGDDDGDTLQRIISWKGRLIAVCRNQIWRVTGYGPSEPWIKEILASNGGTLSPMSVVATEDAMLWWATSGVSQFNGGFGGVQSIDDRFRDQTVDDLNEELRDEITGRYFQGLAFWSFPSAGSNINNRTLIFNPATGRWCVRDFGFYTPEVFIGEDGEEALYFWEPRSGCICKYDPSTVLLPHGSPTLDVKTAHITASNPVDRYQALLLKVVLTASSTETVTVWTAKDYGSTYTAAGTLVPIDTESSGRTSVNATDTAYLCRFSSEIQGASISIRLTASPTASISIHSMEITADPLESETLK